MENNCDFVKTKSLCPSCLKVIEATIFKKRGQLYISKTCPEHGTYEALHPLDIPQQYAEIQRIFRIDSEIYAKPRDLILYITNRCNQNCPICYNDAKKKYLKEPTREEILEKISGYRGEYVHLSGGEPALREDIFEIIQAIRKKGFRVGLFSNGKKLTDKSYVKKLKKSGVNLVILQFDSLDDVDYLLMRKEKLLQIKLKAVENLKNFRIPVYLFAVVVKDINTDQIGKLVKFALDNSEVVKILNFNPVWEIGRNNGFNRVSNTEIYREIEKQTGIKLEEFLQQTELSHYLFELYSKLFRAFLNEDWVRQPACAQRVYVVKTEKEGVAINRIIDIPRLIEYLRILDTFDDRGKINNLWRLFWRLPYGFLLKEFLVNKKIWPFYLFTIKNIVRNGFFLQRLRYGNPWTNLPLFSLMVGVFHNKLDIDLNIVAKCTLYADMADKKTRIPACLRQIYYEDNREPAEVCT